MVHIFSLFRPEWKKSKTAEIPSFRDLSGETYHNFELLMAKLMVNAP